MKITITIEDIPNDIGMKTIEDDEDIWLSNYDKPLFLRGYIDGQYFRWELVPISYNKPIKHKFIFSKDMIASIDFDKENGRIEAFEIDINTPIDAAINTVYSMLNTIIDGYENQSFVAIPSAKYIRNIIDYKRLCIIDKTTQLKCEHITNKIINRVCGKGVSEPFVCCEECNNVDNIICSLMWRPPRVKQGSIIIEIGYEKDTYDINISLIIKNGSKDVHEEFCEKDIDKIVESIIEHNEQI